jgi:hypothetical protein
MLISVRGWNHMASNHSEIEKQRWDLLLPNLISDKVDVDQIEIPRRQRMAAENYEVKRTSLQSAVVSERVLSQTSTTRLVLKPELVVTRGKELPLLCELVTLSAIGER